MDRVTIERGGAAEPPKLAVEEPPDALARSLGHAATRAVLLAGVLIVGGLLFHELVTIVAAGVITVILAIIFSTIAAPLERRGLPRPLGALVGVLALLGGIGGLLALIVPSLLSELQGFAERLPEVAEDLARTFAGVTGGAQGDAGARAERAIEGLSGDPVRFLGPLAAFGAGVAGVLSAFMVMLITAYYMAAHPQPLIGGVLRLFPPARRDWARCLLDRLHAAWSGWLKGVAVDMVVTGTLLYAGLLLIGLEFAFLFAALSALLVVVPYFGAIIGGIPPVLVALTHSPELAALTFLVYVVVQQIEGNVIVPLVMARVVKLHPALIAIGVVVVAQLFGIVGLLVAVPLLSAVVILVDELWIRPMELERGISSPLPEIAVHAGDGRWRRLRRERLEREDARERGLARAEGRPVAEVVAEQEEPEAEPLPRGALLALTLPALGLALAATVVTAFVPLWLAGGVPPAVIGAIVGMEGLVALALPGLVGGWAGRHGRRRFVLAGALLAVPALVGLALVDAAAGTAVLVLGFFVGYFSFYASWRGAVVSGMGVGTTLPSTLRAAGLAAGLVGGSLLASVADPLPFLVAAAALAAVTLVFLLRKPHEEDPPAGDGDDGLALLVRAMRERGDLRRIVVTRSLWELSLAAVKTFVILYALAAISGSMSTTALALAIGAAAVFVATLVARPLERRLGNARVLRLAGVAYAAGLAVPALTDSGAMLPVLPVAAFAGGLLLTLTTSLVLSRIPSERPDEVAGAFEVSRAMGALAGPVLAGVAVQLASDSAAGDGYGAAFGVAALAAAAALPLLWTWCGEPGQPREP